MTPLPDFQRSRPTPRRRSGSVAHPKGHARSGTSVGGGSEHLPGRVPSGRSDGHDCAEAFEARTDLAFSTDGGRKVRAVSSRTIPKTSSASGSVSAVRRPARRSILISRSAATGASFVLLAVGAGAWTWQALRASLDDSMVASMLVLLLLTVMLLPLVYRRDA